MFASGKTVYFVPSLYEESIKGKIIRTETFNNKVVYIVMQAKNGEIIEGYTNQFSLSKPAVYCGNISGVANY